MSTANELRQRFKDRLNSVHSRALIAPGIYDGYGARVLQSAGFEAAYMTGNGVSACLLGRPDVGLVDLSLMASHARHVAACIDVPLICDADTGYGGVVGVQRTVQEFEAAGVCAIHIEDQCSPKRCAQLPGARTVLPFEEAVAKIAAAVAARSDPHFVIIGRTDSAASMGVEEALRRAKAFAEVGAGAVFIELKGHAGILKDIQQLARALPVPCVVNMDAGGALADITTDTLHQHGIGVAIYPGMIRNAVGFAMQEAMQHLKQDGSSRQVRSRMFTSQQYNQVLGLDAVEAWEKQFD